MRLNLFLQNLSVIPFVVQALKYTNQRMLTFLEKLSAFMVQAVVDVQGVYCLPGTRATLGFTFVVLL